MRIIQTLIIMFVASFIIQYYLMTAIMVNKQSDATNSLGKVYMSVLMGLFMLVVETMMHDHQYNIMSYKYYAVYGILIILFIILYRKQIGINDKQYLEGMIEHHSMALLTSEEIMKKSDNYYVIHLAKNIIQTQQDEINKMRLILNKMKSEKGQKY